MAFLAKVAMHGHPVAIMVAIALQGAFLLAGFWWFRDSSKRVKAVWLAFAIAVMIRLPITFVVYRALELNPKVAESGIVGEWREGDLQLDLKADHTFRTGREVGRWQLQPIAALELTPAPLGFERPSFFAFDGEVCLQRMATDPDERDGSLGMRRVR